MKQSLPLIALLILVGCGPQAAVQNPTSSDAAASPAKTTEPPAPAEAPQALDLSRQHIEHLAAEEVAVSEPTTLLPDMLGEAPEEKRVKVGGNLITNKEAQMLKDKVEGVELKIEVSTP